MKENYSEKIKAFSYFSQEVNWKSQNWFKRTLEKKHKNEHVL